MSFELKWYGDRVIAEWTRNGSTGVKDGLEHLLEKAKENAPKDKGDLRESGRVEMEGEGLSGKVTFGGHPSKGVIAVVQHERLNFNHKEGGPKYLERAMISELRTVSNIIAQELRR